jgi:hypothetical protein
MSFGRDEFQLLQLKFFLQVYAAEPSIGSFAVRALRGAYARTSPISLPSPNKRLEPARVFRIPRYLRLRNYRACAGALDQRAGSRGRTREWNRSHVPPARVESAISASAGKRCQVRMCNGSLIGHSRRSIANEKNEAAAPTNSPDSLALIEAPRLTIHHSASNGSAARIPMLYARGRPTRANPPKGLAVSMGSTAATSSVPASTKTAASVASLARRARPGTADRKAKAAEITAAAAKNNISIA